jgi:hypothetical protein
LRRAVDAVVVERPITPAALSEIPVGSSGARLIDQQAEVLTPVLRPQPALLQHIAQALSQNGAGAGELFALLYANADLLKHGLYTPTTPSAPQQNASPPEPSHIPNPERRSRER